MDLTLFSLLCVGLLCQGALGRKGYGPGEQEYGHINVRQGANMFYWLFYVQDDTVQPTDRPLVIWLQGGPGGDSTGFGNFAEIGPLHINGSARATSWAKYANLLFIDNPVGTGYSYVENNNQLARTNEQIGEDMVAFLTQFFNQYDILSSVPLFIVCESYGGKMTVEIAKQILAKTEIDLRSVVLVDSWISPIDSVNTWAPYLYHTGLVDKQGYDEIAAGAETVQKYVDNEQWVQATNAWGSLEGTVLAVTYGVDFYNILTKEGSFGKRLLPELPLDRLYRINVMRDDDADISELMNGPVREALGIDNSIGFGTQSGSVFNALAGDFMKPVTDVVEELLDNTKLNIIVLAGQLDLIVDNLGTVIWVDELEWKGSPEWANAARTPLYVKGYLEGYEKNVDNLSLIWVDRSGHMIPIDNPDTGVAILRKVIGV